jgi:hypothetical protein
MVKDQYQLAVEWWRDQDLAEFGRRAHRHLGRGFVLLNNDEVKPVYVTRLVGAPELLLDAVYGYDPESEALVVCGEPDESFRITRVRIQPLH